MPKTLTHVIASNGDEWGVWSALALSVCLLSRAAAGPRGCPVLYLAGRLLTVSAVSPYTDEWEVSRPFPKLSFPCSNASSRGMAEKTRVPPTALPASLKGERQRRDRHGRAKFKMFPFKRGTEGGGEIKSERDVEEIQTKKKWMWWERETGGGKKRERQKMEGE